MCAMTEASAAESQEHKRGASRTRVLLSVSLESSEETHGTEASCPGISILLNGCRC